MDVCADFRSGHALWDRSCFTMLVSEATIHPVGLQTRRRPPSIWDGRSRRIPTLPHDSCASPPGSAKDTVSSDTQGCAIVRSFEADVGTAFSAPSFQLAPAEERRLVSASYRRGPGASMHVRQSGSKGHPASR